MSSGAIRAGRAFVELLADDNALTRGLRQAEQKLRRWGATIIGIGASIGAAGGVASAGLMDAINTFRDAGADILHTSNATGIGVDRLGELQYAARQLGAPVENVSHGLQHMSSFLLEAAQGSDEARMALQRMGLSVQELLGMSQDERFLRIGEAIGRIGDPAQRIAMARQVFGRGGANDMGFLTAGRARINALGQEGRQLGQVMSPQQVQAARELNQAWSRMTGSFQALAVQVGAALAPEMTRLLDTVTRLVSAVVRWVRENPQVISLIDKFATGAVVLGAAITALGTAMVLLGPAAGAMASGVTAGLGVISLALGALGAAVSAVTFLFNPLTLSLVAAALILAPVAAGVGYLVYKVWQLTGAGEILVGWLRSGLGTALRYAGDLFGQLADTAIGSWNGIRDAITAGDWGLAMRIVGAGLSLGWTQTISFLRLAWMDFKDWFLRTTQEISTGVLQLLSELFREISHLTEGQTGWLARLTDPMSASARDMANALQDLAMAVDRGANLDARLRQRQREQEARRGQETVDAARAAWEALTGDAEEAAAFAEYERQQRAASLNATATGAVLAANRGSAGSFSGEGIAGLAAGGADVLEVNRRQLTQQEQMAGLLAALVNLARAGGGLVMG